MTQSDERSASKERARRLSFDGDIEFVADFDVLKARGIDISEGGLCFELSHPLPFSIKLRVGDREETYRAELIWARPGEGDGYRMGFRLSPVDDQDRF